MAINAVRPKIRHVVGPTGEPLSINDLPPPHTRRWVIRRKAEVVAAVRGGLLSIEGACTRYSLSVEEYLMWEWSIDQHGLKGLRTTRLQQYRERDGRSVILEDSTSPSMRLLAAKLKDAKEMHAAAEDFVELLNSSVVRFESLAIGLGNDIAAQEAYLAERRKSSDVADLPLESLRKRHGNLAHSLQTLRAHAPAAELALQESTEHLTRLVTAVDRTLDAQEVKIPDTAEQ